jgi:hypothetical protein
VGDDGNQTAKHISYAILEITLILERIDGMVDNFCDCSQIILLGFNIVYVKNSCSSA